MILTSDRPRLHGRWLSLAEAERLGWIRRPLDGRWGFCPHLFGPGEDERSPRWPRRAAG